MNSEQLQADYRTHEPLARAFLAEFLHQFAPLISLTDVKLGVPLEGRVKEWTSFSDKLDRKALEIKSCKDVEDFIGIRVITLFERDATTLCKLIAKKFPIKSKEDKANNLDQSHFGYLSRHFVVSLPKTWKKAPAFNGLEFNVEIQVRTLSQHIWAAASHLLQYKKEADVPFSVTRSIHRVAALLETVDLEFERVLDERALYAKSSEATDSGTVLDVDNLKMLLDRNFPDENRGDSESYSELLTDLKHFDITTVDVFKALIKKQKTKVMEMEAFKVAERAALETPLSDYALARKAKGVFYIHIGLARCVLLAEFGENWTRYTTEKKALKKKKLA